MQRIKGKKRNLTRILNYKENKKHQKTTSQKKVNEERKLE